MAVVTRYPSTDIAVSGTWTEPTNVQADDNATALTTIAAKNTTNERQQGNYGFDSAIPTGSTINSVAIEVEHDVSTASGIAFLENLAYVSSTAGAVNSNGNEPTTLLEESFTNYARPGGGSWTRADLLNGTFVTGIRARSGNSATSVTYEWDYIRVAVDYTEPDTTPPTVSTFNPADEATGVAVDANIVITFDEAIQRGTGTITIRSVSASGSILESIDAAASSRISISGSTLTIDPTDPLPGSTVIYVVIPAGAIQDTSSNNYAGTSTYNFTTVATDTTPPTVSTFNPASGATNVLTNANLVLTFDETIQRGTGTITLRSGSAGGSILESFDAAASSRLSLSGSTLTVDPTALLPVSTQVFLVIPSGAIQDTSGNNYAGTSTYSFTTEAAPTVSTFTPTNGATGVLSNANIALGFSKTIARGTGTITLRSGSASGTILESFDAAASGRLTLSGSTFTVDPTSLLPVSTEVFLVVPSGAITDTTGNAYAGTSTYSFTTEDGPTVTTFSPTSGATNVATNGNIVLTFSEAVSRGTGTITLRSGSAGGTILESLNAATSDRISISGSTYTIDPTNLLPTSTQIFAVFPSGSVVDSTGNPYTGTSTYSFTTEAAPTVSTFSPASGATNVAPTTNLVLTFSKAVARGTGTLTLRKSDNTPVETFNAATSDRISISGSTYTVDPTAALDQTTTFFLDIPSGAIADTSGNVYAGTTTYSWTTASGGLVFPTSPTTGATYSFGGRKWKFDGIGWERPLVSRLGDDIDGPLLATTTDHWRIPVGTTEQRTGSPLAGMVRFNSSLGKLETYNGSAWDDAATSTHTHGNISNAGAIGTTANLPIITTTSGVLTTGSFGTAANTFCQGNDARLSDTRNTTNSATFNNGGAGAASGSTFNGSAALTVSYNTVGAPSTTGANASGTWGISITGTAAAATTVDDGTY